MEGGAIAGWISSAAVLIAAITAAYKVWNRVRQDRDTSTIGQYVVIVDRQQKQIEQQEIHVGELSLAVEQLTEEHTTCRIELTELYGEMTRMHDFAVRVAACCHHLPNPPGEPPPMPPRPARPDPAGDEFRQRTLAQTTQNLHELSGLIPPPPRSPDGGR